MTKRLLDLSTLKTLLAFYTSVFNPFPLFEDKVALSSTKINPTVFAFSTIFLIKEAFKIS